MFLVGFLVFLLLGLYLDQVLPKEFGQRRHPCFMFMPSTYTGCCSRRQVPEVDDEEKERRSTLLSKEKNGGGMEVRNLDPRFYEPVAVEIAR
jgi:ATP-binding cassette subfamily A (ABC1) protein 3